MDVARACRALLVQPIGCAVHSPGVRNPCQGRRAHGSPPGADTRLWPHRRRRLAWRWCPAELAHRLHEVRPHGTTSDDEDRLAVLEETAIDRARIAHLEALVRTTVLDDEAEIDGVGTDTSRLGSRS